MIVDWIASDDNVKLLAEAVFWLCVIVLSPVFYKITYYLITPLWVKIFPAKFVELQYSIDGKLYTATVSASDNLSEAGKRLREVAQAKHQERYE